MTRQISCEFSIINKKTRIYHGLYRDKTWFFATILRAGRVSLSRCAFGPRPPNSRRARVCVFGIVADPFLSLSLSLFSTHISASTPRPRNDQSPLTADAGSCFLFSFFVISLFALFPFCVRRGAWTLRSVAARHRRRGAGCNGKNFFSALAATTFPFVFPATTPTAFSQGRR